MAQNINHIIADPAGIYLLKFTNRNTRASEIYSKLTIKTPE